MHCRPSVTYLDTTHKGDALDNQGLLRLRTLSSFQAVPSHERRYAHRDCPSFGNTNHAAAHQRANTNRSLATLNIRIAQIDIEAAHKGNDVAAAQVLSAYTVFSAAQDRKDIEMWRESTVSFRRLAIGTDNQDQPCGNNKYRPGSIQTKVRISKVLDFDEHSNPQ